MHNQPYGDDAAFVAINKEEYGKRFESLAVRAM